jgi:L-seryl-tRNA(Ser) seleniumtransferase
MGIPSWAVEALMRSVGNVVDKVPPEKFDHLKQRAGQWLDELPQTAARGVDSVFRSARAGKERLDRWTRRHLSLVTPVINASGTLADGRLQGVPLGDQTIDLAGEALAAPSLRTPVALERLHRRLHQCTGRSDLAVLVATNIDAACLAVGLSRQGRPLYIHRSQTRRLPSGTPIPDAFMAAGDATAGQDRVHEVGSIDAIAAEDRDKLADHAVLIAVDNGDSNPLWFAPGESDADAKVTIQRMRVLLMSTCGSLQGGAGAAGQWQPAIHPPLRGALEFIGEQRWAASVDLVITSSDGLLGGPPCGLIIGRKAMVAAIAEGQAWPALQASISQTALVVHALETLQGGSPESLPVVAMLKTSEENLRSRAERLATRLSGSDQIQNCQVTDEPAKLTPSGPWRIASRQLRLRHRDKSAAQWAEKLASDVPAVLAQVADDALVIDLRWVQPSDDGPLAAALLGETVAEQPPHPESEQQRESDQQPEPAEQAEQQRAEGGNPS